MKTEKDIETALVKRIEGDLGGMCIKLIPFQLNGLPDRLCLLPRAKLIFVETKAPNKKPRKIQLYIHNKLRALGFDVRIIDSIEQVNLIS